MLASRVQPQQLDRNIAMELVRATEAAAIMAHPWIGRGDKNSADGAAVDAMRSFLSTVDIDGRIVIGEGEKDHAPMLYNGERVGTGRGPAVDIAVDPIDGTSLTAAGRPNALSVIAVSDRDTMYDPLDLFYMDKLVAGPEAVGILDIRQPIAENIHALARATRRAVDQLQIAVLDRPRHAELIEQIRATGATTRLLLDGDVAGGINAARPESAIDMCVGIGGSPEAVITACAVKALEGFMQARPALTTLPSLGGDILDLDDLVSGDNTIFIATAVTDSDLAHGVRRSSTRLTSESLILRSASGTVRQITAQHRAEKWR